MRPAISASESITRTVNDILDNVKTRGDEALCEYSAKFDKTTVTALKVSADEITAASAVDEDLLENHRLLNDLCHRLDASRFTTMADVFMLETDSPVLEIPDVNSYNLYFGWYLGELKQNDEFLTNTMRNIQTAVLDFRSMGQTPIRSIRAQSRIKGIIRRAIRQYSMNTYCK